MIYKLLIDSPEYPAGTTFEKDPELMYGWQMVAHSSDDSSTTSYAETVGQNYADWLERHHKNKTLFEVQKKVEKHYEVYTEQGWVKILVKDFSDEERRAASKAIEALMEFITLSNEAREDVQAGAYADYTIAADKARTLIKREE